MAEGQTAAACCIVPMLGLGIFYIVALAMDSEVSEISCGKVMWYTMCIQTGFLVVGIPLFFSKRDQLEQLKDIQANLQDTSQLKNPASTTDTCISCLLTIGSLVNNSLLLDQVLNISSECQALMEAHSLFWNAAQIQAYLFLTAVCFVGLSCCCCCCIICLGQGSNET